MPVLVTNADTTGAWVPVDRDSYEWCNWGPCDYADVTLEWSPDQVHAKGVAWFRTDATLNGGGWHSPIDLARGFVRVVIANAGDDTSITSHINTIGEKDTTIAARSPVTRLTVVGGKR